MRRRTAVSAQRSVATALADAFLAEAREPSHLGGGWTVDGLACRGAVVLGGDPDAPPRWLVALARAVLLDQPAPPPDAPRALAQLVAGLAELAERFVRPVDGEPADPGPDDPGPDDPGPDDPGPPRVLVRSAAPTAVVRLPWDTPPLHTVAGLAALLGMSVPHLEWYADARAYGRTAPEGPLQHYRHTWLAKPAGGHRLLESPKWRLTAIQRRLLHEVLDAVPPHDATHGFRRGRSALTHAAAHAGSDVVLRMDLENFFGAVTAARAYGILQSAGYPEPVAHTLAALVTTVTPLAVRRRAPRTPPGGERVPGARARMLRALATPHLPQGAPTSPALANLAAYRLDLRLAGLAARHGLTYTRYADDLVLSGDRSLRRLAPRLVGWVAAVAGEEGFRVHPGKTAVVGRGQRQVVGGLVVNVRPHVARHEVDRLRAVLHDAVRHGPAHANRGDVPDFRAHLTGRVAWVEHVHPERGARLRAELARVTW